MYAIIVDGGKQYKVREGEEVQLDYREGSAGDKLTFDRVLMTSDGSKFNIGTPALSGASVAAEIVGTVQGPKLVVQKFRKRKNSKRRTGHRQVHTVVKIGKLSV
jgi:large subunit ribosomal protein L21